MTALEEHINAPGRDDLVKQVRKKNVTNLALSTFTTNSFL